MAYRANQKNHYEVTMQDGSTHTVTASTWREVSCGISIFSVFAKSIQRIYKDGKRGKIKNL